MSFAWCYNCALSIILLDPNRSLLPDLLSGTEKVEEQSFKSDNNTVNTISLNCQSIRNDFNRRSTNASAESINTKTKAFRVKFGEVEIRSFSFNPNICLIHNNCA